MPSVLVETGFLTNASEGAFLNSAKGQVNMASAISKAIANYKKLRDASFIAGEVIREENTVKTETLNNDKVEHSFLFKVQIAASKNKLKLKPYNFKGLKEIYRIKSGKLYRYYYSQSNTYEKAQQRLKEAKRKGYSKAFVVAFDGDKKITISEALRRSK